MGIPCKIRKDHRPKNKEQRRKGRERECERGRKKQETRPKEIPSLEGLGVGYKKTKYQEPGTRK
jgi:hypothetical protein